MKREARTTRRHHQRDYQSGSDHCEAERAVTVADLILPLAALASYSRNNAAAAPAVI
jgi:hypothetical protein